MYMINSNLVLKPSPISNILLTIDSLLAFYKLIRFPCKDYMHNTHSAEDESLLLLLALILPGKLPENPGKFRKFRRFPPPHWFTLPNPVVPPPKPHKIL